VVDEWPEHGVEEVMATGDTQQRGRDVGNPMETWHDKAKHQAVALFLLRTEVKVVYATGKTKTS